MSTGPSVIVNGWVICDLLHLSETYTPRIRFSLTVNHSV